MSIFTSLYKEVLTYYVEDVNPNKLMQTSLDAMLASLDPYTNYISEDRIEDYRTMNTGEYGGIGASTIRVDGRTYISMIFKGYPADGSGLIIGDQVLAINNVPITGKTREDINQLMKGQNDTDVILSVKRYNIKEPINIEIGREKITIDNVPYSGILDGNKGYVKLNEFTMNASKNVKDAVIKLKKEGAEGIILDLRGNPGGLLIEAVNLSNIFLPKGVPIVSTHGKIIENDMEYISRFNPVDTEIPLVVLVNSGSASASEIVAGVMQDYDRGVLIGQKSYGKGLVQTTRRLSYNAQLKVTTAKYYVPSGRCIQALDYTHRRSDGSVGSIPDSLITQFKTQNERIVFDGGGIDPDLGIELEKQPVVASELLRSGLIFKYATKYYFEHDQIDPPSEFLLTTKDYDQFTDWLAGQDFSYQTNAEKSLEEIKNTAKKEETWIQIKDEYAKLQSEIERKKTVELNTYKKQISRLLEKEIVSRYYFESGAVESGFVEDIFVIKAIEILNSSEKYLGLLN